MTEHPTGTAKQFLDRLQECENSLKELLRIGASPRNIQRLRKRLGESISAMVLECVRLQPKAITKLGQPFVSGSEERGIWWVNDRSLQQATPWQVAKFKAQWLTADFIADLCCGIGGDAISLPVSKSITAIDRDPLVAAMAQANLMQRQSSDRIEVLCQDVQEFHPASGTDLHIDPDRRSAGRRQTAPEHYEPSWQVVLDFVQRFPAAVKLAPLARIADDRLPSMHHRCWISLQRSVREQSLLCGDLVERHQLKPNGRSAVAISADATSRVFAPDGDSDLSAEVVSHPATQLIDPDPAIRAAELTETFAAQFGLGMIGGPIGFLTSDRERWSHEDGQSMAVASHVIWQGPCDLKKIRRELRTRNAYAETAKVRGTDHDPAKILKPLRHTGDQPLTLWIGRNTDHVYAALTERV